MGAERLKEEPPKDLPPPKRAASALSGKNSFTATKAATSNKGRKNRNFFLQTP
jgi:hypothetical protein